jgi:hypothetical protein
LLILKRCYTNGTWYIACVLSVGCIRTEEELVSDTPADITRTQYAKCRLRNTSWGWASNARNVLRPLTFIKLYRKRITLVSLYWGNIIVIDTMITHFCTNCRLCGTSWGWASNARNVQRPLIVNKLNENCFTLVSLYWYTMMHGQQNIKSPRQSISCLACQKT